MAFPHGENIWPWHRRVNLGAEEHYCPSVFVHPRLRKNRETLVRFTKNILLIKRRIKERHMALKENHRGLRKIPKDDGYHRRLKEGGVCP